jgi:hypothetical protein
MLECHVSDGRALRGGTDHRAGGLRNEMDVTYAIFRVCFDAHSC